jgi:hypothetical protein
MTNRHQKESIFNKPRYKLQKRLSQLIILSVFILFAVTACNKSKEDAELAAISAQIQEMKAELEKSKGKASAEEIAKMEKAITEKEQSSRSAGTEKRRERRGNKSSSENETDAQTPAAAATTTQTAATPAASTTTTTPTASQSVAATAPPPLLQIYLSMT